MGAELDLAVRFVETMQNRMAERVLPMRHGSALFHDRLPLVWNLNFVRLERDDPFLAAGDVIVETDDMQGSAGLAHRRIEVNLEALGRRLEPEFRTAGWKVKRRLVMTQQGVASTPAVTIVEVDARALRPKWEQGIRSAPWAEAAADGVRQHLEAQEIRESVVDVRYFAARVDGRLVSECSLFSDGRTAQVEAVHTLDDYRGRGLARGVIARAVDEARRARHELVFLKADDDEWPKELYRKLGFTSVGRVWEFVRAPSR